LCRTRQRAEGAQRLLEIEPMSPIERDIEVVAALVETAAHLLSQIRVLGNVSLYSEHRLLMHQSETLAREWTVLLDGDHRGHDAHPHKVRQLVTRLDAHVEQLRTLLANLRPKP